MTKKNSITLIQVKMFTYKQMIKTESPIHRDLDDEAKIFVSGHILPLHNRCSYNIITRVVHIDQKTSF